MKKIGIVIEGGGFRGIYTAGILDLFLDKKWYLPYVIGVSMGACNGANYISKQRGRSINVPFRFIKDNRYISYKNLICSGNLFGMDFIFNEIPYKHDIFDFNAYFSSKQEFIITAMDCETGKAEYFKKNELNESDTMLALKASCSLPLISKMIKFKDKNYLDGGVSDSIPVRKAFEDGVDKAIVLLTREKGYRKKSLNHSNILNLAYRKNKEVVKAMENRSTNYNESLEYIEQLEKEGKVLCVYPDSPIDLGRVERNPEKLMKVYNDGYNKAKKMEEEIYSFIYE